MRKNIAALAILILLSGQSVASEETDLMIPVRQLFDSFNKGDATTATAGCADVRSIIDDFPPHQWLGSDACSKWMSSYKDYAKKMGITNMAIILSAPTHVDITADLAYVVVPAGYTLKKQGKPVTSTNSVVTLTLKKVASGWRVTGWAWADP